MKSFTSMFFSVLVNVFSLYASTSVFLKTEDSLCQRAPMDSSEGSRRNSQGCLLSLLLLFVNMCTVTQGSAFNSLFC